MKGVGGMPAGTKDVFTPRNYGQRIWTMEAKEKRSQTKIHGHAEPSL